MTLILLRITHFQGHQSQKKNWFEFRNMIENFQNVRNFLIKKIRNFDAFADERWVAGLYRELRGTWFILWDVHSRAAHIYVQTCMYITFRWRGGWRSRSFFKLALSSQKANLINQCFESSRFRIGSNSGPYSWKKSRIRIPDRST